LVFIGCFISFSIQGGPSGSTNGLYPHSIANHGPSGSTNGLDPDDITNHGPIGSTNGIDPDEIEEENPHGTIPGSTNGIPRNGLINGYEDSGFTHEGASVILNGFTLSAVDSIRENNPDNNLDELLPYLVHCALPPWKSWIGTLNGEETEIWGQAGLAADLEQIPMLPTQQQLISACLLSLVNYFGEHIEISPRNYPSSATTKDEMKDFRVFEGAFFGDIFSEDTTIKKFSCQGTPTRVALAQSGDREWRRCTDPEYDCEMEVVGDCSEVCTEYTDDFGYSQCTGSDGVSYPAINVFLKSKRN